MLQADLARWKQFVEQFMWPRGPLHKTHYMVLSAKMQVVSVLARSQQGIERHRLTAGKSHSSQRSAAGGDSAL